MNDKYLKIIEQSGLRPEVVGDLLDKGWVFVETPGEGFMWVAPGAGGIPDYIPHKEPPCDYNCMNMAPHRHGLSCNTRCRDCHGVCHPDCPAYGRN